MGVNYKFYYIYIYKNYLRPPRQPTTAPRCVERVEHQQDDRSTWLDRSFG